MKSRLVVNAIDNAVALRGDVAGCVVHSDRGSQFRARKTIRTLPRHGLVGSMGRVGAAGDNAAMEMLLSLSSGRGRAFQESEDVTGVVPLEAPHRFSLRLTLSDPSREIVARLRVHLHAREDRGVKRSVELTVTAA